MHTELCDRLGIEFPIFAFTHCRDVVAAVGKAGGFGVLGAVGFPPDQLEIELKWIDEHIGDRPYGVDIVIPGKYEGMGEIDPKKLEEQLLASVPPQHRAFADKVLADHGVPKLPEGERPVGQLLGWTAATATPQVEVALKHPKVKLIANALGTPPTDIIDEIHRSGRLVAALCGSPKHARSHKAAGIDIIIAQGYEGGGHTGEIGSVVLWPEVIDAVAPTPVLAAGGIGTGRQIAAALAMGAQGVWTGSLWLTVQEADAPPAQMQQLLDATSRDTVRSRSFTGKPCRMLRNDWTEAWEGPDSPGPLGMPLQFMVTSDAVARGHRYADKAKKVLFNPVGQIVGQMNSIRPVREVIRSLVEEYLEATERLQRLTAGAE
ncbi:MAG TPA: nitronate monooxygenase family protein [Candidatus Binatia bacterium]|nr:nitronate monooxygenase family protein [Candidatus Binatia bacterium]